MKVSRDKPVLRRPKGYRGTLYEKVTKKHWNYLEALANCGNRPVPWNPDWKRAYKELTGIDSHGPPGTMTSGVFKARGWVKRIGKRSPFRYRIAPEGRAVVAIRESCTQAEDQQPFIVEEAENLDEAPFLSKEEAKFVLQNFRAFMPKFSVRSTRRYERSKVGRALKALYDGRCQICEFTFPKRDGTNYAEVHHLESLSEGGWEDPRNMLVVCANCHRQLHYGRVKRIGWENDRLMLEINGKIRRIRFHPSHLAS